MIPFLWKPRACKSWCLNGDWSASGWQGGGGKRAVAAMDEGFMGRSDDKVSNIDCDGHNTTL